MTPRTSAALVELARGQRSSKRCSAAAGRRRTHRGHHRDRGRQRGGLGRGRDPAGPPRGALRPQARPAARGTRRPGAAMAEDGSTSLRLVRSSRRWTGYPLTGEFAVSVEQRVQAEGTWSRRRPSTRREGAAGPGAADLRGHRPRPGRGSRGQGAGGRRRPKALRRTTLSMWEDDEGTCHGRFRIPALHGQMLTKMILAITSPARSVATVTTGTGRDRSRPARPVRTGLRSPSSSKPPGHALPKAGGCGATVVVTMTLEQLPGGPRRGWGVHPGHRRPHLRCRSPPTGLRRRDHPDRPGRQVPGPRRRPNRRLHTEAMRLAMGVRDHGCTAQGCETPGRSVSRPPDNPGTAASPPTSSPAGCCVATTTAASTTRRTRPAHCPTAAR